MVICNLYKSKNMEAEANCSKNMQMKAKCSKDMVICSKNKVDANCSKNIWVLTAAASQNLR